MKTRTLAILAGAGVVTAVGVALLIPKAGASTLASGTVTVFGTGGVRLAGVVVSIGSYSAITNASGVATFANIPQPATYNFSASLTGYLTYTGTFSFSGASSTFSFQITLTP